MWLRRGCGVCQGVHAADWGGCGWEGGVVYVRGGYCGVSAWVAEEKSQMLISYAHQP